MVHICLNEIIERIKMMIVSLDGTADTSLLDCVFLIIFQKLNYKNYQLKFIGN